jgi:hypothetical protein
MDLELRYMADKDAELTIDNVSYEKEPEKYCQLIYDEASKRNDDLSDINEENRLFYEGTDEILENRNSDTRVKRSALFVHETTPAIDTRIGDVVSRLEGFGENPLFVRFNGTEPTPAEKDQLIFIEQQLNRDLRDSNYLTDVFREHILAAEIYRTPSTVKVGWGRGHKMVPQAIIPSDDEIIDAATRGKTPPTPQVRFVKRKIDGPFVEWLPPDQFLYEPNRSDYFQTSRYSIHRMWMSWDELFAEAEDNGWDIDKIRQLKEAKENLSDDGTSTHQEEIDEANQVAIQKGFKEGKVLVTENYIITYDKQEREKTNLAVMVGNKELVFNGPSTIMAFKFPFVPVVAHRLPGTIEGLSSIDRTKNMQRLNNEIINSWIDGISYRVFPPMKVGPGFSMKKQPLWGPAELFHCSDPNDLQPVVTNPGDLPDLAALRLSVSSAIRQMLAGAVDINQGFNANQYEKATSTRLRAEGSARRATTTYRNYGEAIIKVAEMFLGMNQQFHEEKERFVMDVSLDVPALTNVLDPDQEKNDAMLMYELMGQNPVYTQTKAGQIKYNAMLEHIMRLFMRRKVNDFRITPKELEQAQEADRLQQEAALEQQAVAQEAQLEGAQ